MRIGLSVVFLIFSCSGFIVRSTPTPDSLDWDRHQGAGKRSLATDDVGSGVLLPVEKSDPNINQEQEPPTNGSSVTVNIIVMDPPDQNAGNAPPSDPNACSCSCLCPYSQFSVPEQRDGGNSGLDGTSSTGAAISQTTDPSSTSQAAIVPLDEFTSELPSTTAQIASSDLVEQAADTGQKPPTSSTTIASPTTSTADNTSSTTTSAPQESPSSTTTEEAPLDPDTMQLHSVLTLKLGG